MNIAMITLFRHGGGKNPPKPPDFFTAGTWKHTFSKRCFQDVFLRIKHSGWQNQDASFRMKDSGCVFQNDTFRKFHLSKPLKIKGLPRVGFYDFGRKVYYN